VQVNFLGAIPAPKYHMPALAKLRPAGVMHHPLADGGSGKLVIEQLGEPQNPAVHRPEQITVLVWPTLVADGDISQEERGDLRPDTADVPDPGMHLLELTLRKRIPRSRDQVPVAAPVAQDAEQAAGPPLGCA
jgi:hypothetical protein